MYTGGRGCVYIFEDGETIDVADVTAVSAFLI